jgi:hypothetical protein
MIPLHHALYMYMAPLQAFVLHLSGTDGVAIRRDMEEAH